MKRVPLPESWRHALVIRDAELTRDWFTDDELAIVDALPTPKRREQWMLSRIAVKQLALDLRLCADPQMCTYARPHVLQSWFASVSHSGPYAGAIIGRDPVGIDVQEVRELSERAAHLFLSDLETRAMASCTLEHRLLHFWCAKEAAWKQRSGDFETLKQLPLVLVDQRDDGLLFDAAETRRIGDVIVAVTLPIS
ncbi:MAG TPA: 4'-phosphopantetheinyl transferase superfamily protein [Thermoanaerobaculia bacterium]|jgi:4'-phosphopantetheinyl transferase EntD